MRGGGGTYFPTCLFRKALSLAVQGLWMLSEGEMYCFVLVGWFRCQLPLVQSMGEGGAGGTYSLWLSILDCRT